VTIEHAVTVFVDQFLQRDPRRRKMNTWLLDAAAYRKRPYALASVAALAGKPGWSLLKDVAHPMQRLHIVLQGGTSE